MYNLAHIYIYDTTIISNIDKSIQLLIKSAEQFFGSLFLLCLALIKRVGFDIEKIKRKIRKELVLKTRKKTKMESKQEIKYKMTKKSKYKLYKSICNIIYEYNLLNESIFNKYDKLYQTKEYVYNIELYPISLPRLKKRSNKKKTKYPNAKDISSLFYEGFGIDL